MLNYQTVWVVASCVLLFFTAFPALVIFFCSLCIARRKTDPSRNWLVWFRAGFILFAVAHLCLFIVYLFAVIFSDLYSSDSDSITSTDILPAQVELDLIGSLLANFSEICIILALNGLDNGIIIAHKTEHRRGDMDLVAGAVQLVDKIFYFSVYGLAGVLAVLSIAAFGLGQHLYSQYGLTNSRIGYNHSFVGLSYSHMNLGKTSQLLSLAMYIMILAVMLFITIKSIVTKVRCRGDRRVKMASTYLIVCDTLFLLRGVYNVTYAIVFRPRNSRSSSNVPSAVFTMIDVVVDTWPAFVIFCILFALGCKKRGLWSTKQPPTPGLLDVTPQQTPRSYSHNTSQPSDQDLESNMQQPQMHEMLQVTSHDAQMHEPMPQHQIPRRPVNLPHVHQQQQQQQQMRDTLAAEGVDDSPPDYYSARHQAPPQHSPHHVSPFQPVVDNGQVQAGPSFALPAQRSADSIPITGSPPLHPDAMGLYHQADGRSPDNMPLPGSLPPHTNAMGLYHQADGRSPDSMPIPGSPPPHADAMGLYHQADGRTPQSQALPYNEKSSA